MATIDPRKDPARRCLPLDEWPATDRAAWATAVKVGDLLDDAGPAAHWRDGTRRKVMSSYGRWLTFLHCSGWLDPVATPAARVNRDRVAAFIDELRRTVAPVTTQGRIRDLGEALRVMAPEHDWSSLRMIDRRLTAAAVPVRAKRSRVRHSKELFDLGLSLMERALAGSYRNRRWREVAYRDGLMIAFLAARPLRRRSFAALRLDHHVVRQAERYLLRLGPEDLKTGGGFELPLPDALTGFLDRYVAEIRPVLLQGRSSDALWIAVDGEDLDGLTIYMHIRRITERELGVAINPHLFRDSLATSLALDDPDHVRAAMTLLGHRSLETTNRHYNQATGLAASRRHQAEIRRLRQAATSRKIGDRRQPPED